MPEIPLRPFVFRTRHREADLRPKKGVERSHQTVDSRRLERKCVRFRITAYVQHVVQLRSDKAQIVDDLAEIDAGFPSPEAISSAPPDTFRVARHRFSIQLSAAIMIAESATG